MPEGTPGSTALRWGSTPVVLRVSPPSPNSEISLGELQRVATEAISAWRTACQECKLPAVSIQVLEARGAARLDGLSTLTFQAGSWCPARAEEDCYDPGRSAITHQRPLLDSAQPDVLAEADIEINAAHFKWSLDGMYPPESSTGAFGVGLAAFAGAVVLVVVAFRRRGRWRRRRWGS